MTDVGKFVATKVAEVLPNGGKCLFTRNISNNISKNAIKYANAPQMQFDQIATNQAGRILRMQDAKDAFVLANRKGVVLTEKTQMKPSHNIKLITENSFVERFKKLYPEISPAERLNARKSIYDDLCYLFGKLNIK